MLPKILAKPPPEAPVAFGPLTFVPGLKGGRHPYCHSLVLKGPDETWVVDPSSQKDYLAHLSRTRRVTRVFLSHFHEDHQKYNHLFPNAAFYVPASEIMAFTSLDGVFDLMGIASPQFQDYWRETLIKEFHFRPLANLVSYEPGQRFSLGENTLEVMAAPGHTPGHSAFYFPRQDLLYLADVDLTPFGPWYGDLTSDLEAFGTTLKRLKTFEARIYLTAHEQGIFNFQEFQAGLAHFEQVIAAREARLLKLLKTPRTLKELVAHRPCYGKAKEPAFVYDHFEIQMLTKHLDRLLKQGTIHTTPTGWVAG